MTLMLFDTTPDVRNSDPVTSRQAAATNPAGRSKLRWQILHELEWAGSFGRTDYELARQLDLLHMRGSVSKRRGDLFKAGLVRGMYDWGTRKTRTRPTDSGSAAIVWGLTPAGVALAEKGMP